MIMTEVALGFADRQGRLRVIEALELRIKQFRGREEIWPFRVPHDPLDLDGIIERALDGQGAVAHDALKARTILEFLWDAHRWELWVLALPSGISQSDPRVGQTVTVRVRYHQDLLIPLISAILPRDAGGRLVLTGEVTMVIN